MPRVSYETINAGVIGTVDRPGGPLRRMAEVLVGAMQGKVNVGGSGVANGTSSTITDSRIGAQSLILFMPTTAAGANLQFFVTSRGNGVAQISHQSAVNVPFEYAVIG